MNGTAKVIGWSSTVIRKIQTGVVSTYAFAMIIGVFAMLTWVFVRLYVPN